MFPIHDRVRRRWHRSAQIAEDLAPLRRLLPTARIRDAVMSRRGLKWGIPAMLLALPYLAVIAFLNDYIAQAGPEWGWLHLVNLLCAYNTLKMILLGPLSLIALVRERHREHKARRHEARNDSTRGFAMAGGAS